MQPHLHPTNPQDWFFPKAQNLFNQKLAGLSRTFEWTAHLEMYCQTYVDMAHGILKGTWNVINVSFSEKASAEADFSDKAPVEADLCEKASAEAEISDKATAEAEISDKALMKLKLKSIYCQQLPGYK